MIGVAEREGLNVAVQIHDAIIFDRPENFDESRLEEALADEFRKIGILDLSAKIKEIAPPSDENRVIH